MIQPAQAARPQSGLTHDRTRHMTQQPAYDQLRKMVRMATADLWTSPSIVDDRTQKLYDALLAEAGIRGAARQAAGQPAACPTPESHNWGCGRPTDRHPAAGLAAPTNHDTDAEEDARHELYGYATVTFHEAGIPESVHAYVTRLIATYRTAILTAAADKAEAVAIRLHNAGETTASNGANEAMSALRRLAAGAES